MQSPLGLAGMGIGLAVCAALTATFGALLCWGGGCGVGDEVVLTVLLAAFVAACWYFIARAAVQVVGVGGSRALLSLLLVVPSVVVNSYATYMLYVVVRSNLGTFPLGAGT
jgi:hypothetical protein